MIDRFPIGPGGPPLKPQPPRFEAANSRHDHSMVLAQLLGGESGPLVAWLRTHPEQSLAMALGQLAPRDRNHLENQLSLPLEHWIALSEETDPFLFYHGIYQKAGQLAYRGRGEAAAIYRFLTEASGVPDPVRHRARHQLALYQGGGSWGERLEFHAQSLVPQVFQLAPLLAMSSGGVAFRLGRFFSLKGLVGLGQRGWLARGLAGLIGLGTETLAFTGTLKGVNYLLGHEQDTSLSGWGRELASTGILLGSLRLLGFGTSAGFRWARPSGEWTARTLTLQGLATHAGQYGGIVLGHKIQTRFDLLPEGMAQNLWLDSLALYFQFQLAGRISHGLLGSQLRPWENSLDCKTRNLFPPRPSSSSKLPQLLSRPLTQLRLLEPLTVGVGARFPLKTAENISSRPEGLQSSMANPSAPSLSPNPQGRFAEFIPNPMGRVRELTAQDRKVMEQLLNETVDPHSFLGRVRERFQSSLQGYLQGEPARQRFFGRELKLLAELIQAKHYRRNDIYYRLSILYLKNINSFSKEGYRWLRDLETLDLQEIQRDIPLEEFLWSDSHGAHIFRFPTGYKKPFSFSLPTYWGGPEVIFIHHPWGRPGYGDHAYFRVQGLHFAINQTIVSELGVQWYRQRIQNREPIPPIQILRDPDSRIFHVDDGFHRAVATVEEGHQYVLGKFNRSQGMRGQILRVDQIQKVSHEEFLRIRDEVLASLGMTQW